MLLLSGYINNLINKTFNIFYTIGSNKCREPPVSLEGLPRRCWKRANWKHCHFFWLHKLCWQLYSQYFYLCCTGEKINSFNAYLFSVTCFPLTSTYKFHAITLLTCFYQKLSMKKPFCLVVLALQHKCHLINCHDTFCDICAG